MLGWSVGGAQTALPGGVAASAVIAVDHGPNALVQQGKHYVILVSLDGFRWDYATKYKATHLLAMAKDGASAPEGMIPSYPSVTFPNHYTLVTGLYPEHHGIVAMDFLSEDHARHYRYSDSKTNGDGSWYGGTPLWVLAEQQGMRAACFFWPGSEAAIDGVRPSFYLHYDDKLPNPDRVDQVLAWLKLPEAQRPHFVTLYFADVDHAGHSFGPDAPETAAAVKSLDSMIARLRTGIAALHLPVDLVVVSDHGMIKTEGDWINLSTYADVSDPSQVHTAGSLLYPENEAEAQKLYSALKIANPDFKVYRRADVPKELHYNSNPREGDPVIVPTAPVAIRAAAPESGKPDHAPNAGSHGYDPAQFKEMRAIFFAEGPDVRAGIALKPFENVNVYPFIAEILGLEAPPVDGSANVLAPALKH
ncbi:alkaline phosphatase family protein [Acidipila sp. EB88]|nr:alkaline phosphatase family protein [Acidipila sp. EB88]